MKKKLGEIRSLVIVINKVKSQDIDAKIAYKLKKQTAKLRIESEGIEEGRLKIVQKYLEGKEKIIAKDKAQKFMDEFNKFLNQETEINIDPINVEELINIKDLKISTNDIEFIEDFFKPNPKPKKDSKDEEKK